MCRFHPGLSPPALTSAACKLRERHPRPVWRERWAAGGDHLRGGVAWCLSKRRLHDSRWDELAHHHAWRSADVKRNGPPRTLGDYHALKCVLHVTCLCAYRHQHPNSRLRQAGRGTRSYIDLSFRAVRVWRCRGLPHSSRTAVWRAGDCDCDRCPSNR